VGAFRFEGEKTMMTTSLYFASLRARSFLQGRLRNYELIRQALSGKHGLEIGGPSDFFLRKWCPIYDVIGSLSNVVFSRDTVWEGERAHGKTFSYHPKREPGFNYILDGSDLQSLPNESFDFVLSCHNLEHVANPVKALKEWHRVLKPRGHLLLVLPDKRYTFDHKRPLTSVQHMLSDYQAGIGEDDLSHLPEILALHDVDRDKLAGGREAFVARSYKNFDNRCLHQHTFSLANVRELLEAVGYKVLASETALPFHICAFSQRQ
jgi:SAM-dependent methyltransferase